MKVCVAAGGANRLPGCELALFGFDFLGEVDYENELAGKTDKFEEAARLSRTYSCGVVCGCKTVSRGVVSKVYEVSNTNIAGEIRAISGFRVDASINKGNSGGGIFNLDGEFIGISNAKYIGIGYEGLGNAIYSNTVKAIYQNILDGFNKGDGSSVGVKRLSLGISYNKVDNVGSDYDESTGLTTATIIPEVVSVNDGSVADVVGLQVGDLLVGVKVERGESSFTYDITMPYNLTEICINVRAGDKIFVIVERNNERVELAEYTVLETDFVESKDNA